MTAGTVTAVNTPNPIQKLVMNKWFWIFISLFLFAYPIYRSMNRVLPPDLPVLYTLPEFKLTDENGKTFGSEELKGKPYIANFHFTSCPTSCPEIMKATQKIQKRVRGLGTKVAIVSFTVDPNTDTSKVLFDHARELHANPHVWRFLTGPFKELENIIMGGFKFAIGAKQPFNNVYDIAHAEKFVLVDEKGQIRAYYSNEKTEIDKMMIDLGLLINKLIHRRS